MVVVGMCDFSLDIRWRRRCALRRLLALSSYGVGRGFGVCPFVLGTDAQMALGARRIVPIAEYPHNYAHVKVHRHKGLSGPVLRVLKPRVAPAEVVVCWVHIR